MYRKIVTLIFILIISITIGNNTNVYAKEVRGSFFINQKKQTMEVGESMKLKIRKKKKLRVKKKTFISSNKKVATVTKTGRIHARKTGNTTIRVKIKYKSKSSKKIKNKTLKCKIIVRENSKFSSNNKKPSSTEPPITTRAAGLYNSDGNMLKTWAQLLEEETEGKEKRIVVNSVLGKTVLEKCDRDFDGILVIPREISSIGENALRGCTGLTEIEISGNVTEIGANAYAGCKKLSKIMIPASVKSIGQRAFYGCSSLFELDIPSGVKSIGILAFYNVPLVVYKGDATGSPWGADALQR